MANLSISDPPNTEFDPTNDQAIDPTGCNARENIDQTRSTQNPDHLMATKTQTYKIKPTFKTKTKKIPTSETHTNTSTNTSHVIITPRTNITSKHRQSTKDLNIIIPVVNNI